MCGMQRQSIRGKLRSNEAAKSPKHHIETQNYNTNADFPGLIIPTSVLLGNDSAVNST